MYVPFEETFGLPYSEIVQPFSSEKLIWQWSPETAFSLI